MSGLGNEYMISVHFWRSQAFSRSQHQQLKTLLLLTKLRRWRLIGICSGLGWLVLSLNFFGLFQPLPVMAQLPRLADRQDLRDRTDANPANPRPVTPASPAPANPISTDAIAPFPPTATQPTHSGNLAGNWVLNAWARPRTGAQLYALRRSALTVQEVYPQIRSPLPSEWMVATAQPTYEDWKTLLSQEAQLAAQLPSVLPSVVTLGDSLTLWLPTETFPDRRWLNQGISGETAAALATRLEPIAALQPQTVYVMAGLNDLLQGRSVADISSNLRQIVQTLRQNSPDTSVVLQSVLPTRSSRVANQDILALNQQLATIAQEEGAIYLDLFADFTDANGALRANLTTDGLHLNEEGYEIWQAFLAQMEYQLAYGWF